MLPSQGIESFLEDFLATRWQPSALPPGITCDGVYLGEVAGGALEVVYLRAGERPRLDDLRRTWRDRSANRPTPVLVVAAYTADGQEKADLVGLRSDAGVQRGVDLRQVERLSQEALDARTTAEAERLLANLFVAVADDAVPGLRNEGLFAGHELLENVPRQPSWQDAVAQSRPWRDRRGRDLLTALGWQVTPRGSTGNLLTGAGGAGAVAVILEGGEVFDRRASRFSDASPVEHALALAENENVPWVLAVQGDVVRLYAANPDVGVGRKGATATFTEVQLRALPDDRLGYAALLLTPDALRDGGSAARILQASTDHATGVGERLRDRVYTDVVPTLAETVAAQLRATTEQELREAYHVTLVILFRLLFVAYAEDRGLLPYRINTAYTQKALKTRARHYTDLLAEHGAVRHDPSTTAVWEDLQRIWAAVDGGDAEWGVPAYSGGLFAAEDSRGQAIARLRLTDAEVGPALEKLLVDTGRDGTRGPVDFTALSVREFGTIYEGLLESSLSLAPGDLALDDKAQYVPAKTTDDVVVPAGSIYFHNSSGARKATGSYFTKQFAVEHLLRTALDPALDDHLSRVRELLDAGDEAGAAGLFFDFRVADIAMGSGHFLVGAVDHIALRFSTFLTRSPIPGISVELTRLRRVALERLQDASVDELPDIAQNDLLRRQVARRCIYGVDINQIAVDLARLALWIHTFVPGLPMSSLEHGLVQGNSLTGIGTLPEAIAALTHTNGEATRDGDGQISMFEQPIKDALEDARAVLVRVSRTAEATAAEVQEAAAAHAEALERAEPARALLDAAVAGRLSAIDIGSLSLLGPERVIHAGRSAAVRERLSGLDPLHFPAVFPEVFLRENPGFDVILGNPPWEKVHIERHQWWGLRFPGLRSMPAAAMSARIDSLELERPDLTEELDREQSAVDGLRAVLSSGPFPGVGAGHVDLYKAFCWRDWDLLAEGGRAGVVLPRGAHSGTGTSKWRARILEGGSFEDVCFLTNNRQWIFDEVHPQYTIGLTTIRRGGPRIVGFNGPFHSLTDYARGHRQGLRVEANEFAAWAGGATFPLLPDNASVSAFHRLRQHPRLDFGSTASFRPVQGDINATTNKSLLRPSGDVSVLTGGSFNIWDPDFGPPYSRADRAEVESHLRIKRLRQARTSSSAFFGVSTSEAAPLPMHSARIAFRDVARATDTRTVLAALIPPDVLCTHKAPYLYRQRGNAADEAFLLGILCSIPFDWYARRYVEITLSFELLNPMPVPQVGESDIHRVRLVQLSGRLAAVDDRYSTWAAEVGVPVGSVSDPADKSDLIAEIDALVAILYGLDRNDVQHIFETFHRGWNYAPRLTAVLTHYDKWKQASA